MQEPSYNFIGFLKPQPKAPSLLKDTEFNNEFQTDLIMQGSGAYIEDSKLKYSGYYCDSTKITSQPNFEILDAFSTDWKDW